MKNIPRPRSLRDKYGFSKIKPNKSKSYDLTEFGGTVDNAYNMIKCRAFSFGKTYGVKLAVRKNGDKCVIYRE